MSEVATVMETDHPEHDLDEEDFDLECHTCGGEGWGIVGVHWDSDDPVNGPYPSEVEKCPNCLGSGLAKDCWYW